MRRLKGVFKSLMGWMLLKTGLYKRALRDRAFIVTLHRVGEAYPGDDLGISAQRFATLCDLLASAFEPVSLTQLLDKLEAGQDISLNVAITFDDGYLDNYTTASPILRQRGLPACFFVTTGFVGTHRIPGWDADDGVESRWMSWPQVEELKSQGFDIGAHTVNHVNLGDAQVAESGVGEVLPDHWGVNVSPERVAQEIRDSKLELEQRLGGTVDHFAYPFGRRENITEGNRRLIEELGYRSCVSSFGGLVAPDSSPYALQRINLGEWLKTPAHLVVNLWRASRAR